MVMGIEKKESYHHSEIKWTTERGKKCNINRKEDNMTLTCLRIGYTKTHRVCLV